jgi:hypothetical protein
MVDVKRPSPDPLRSGVPRRDRVAVLLPEDEFVARGPTADGYPIAVVTEATSGAVHDAICVPDPNRDRLHALNRTPIAIEAVPDKSMDLIRKGRTGLCDDLSGNLNNYFDS